MSGVDIAAKQRVLFGCGFCRNNPGIEIGIRGPVSAEALRPDELIARHPHRNARPAAIARWAVGDVLASAKSALRQSIVQRAGVLTDQMSEDFPLEQARQIGTRSRRRDEELWKILPFDAQSQSSSCRSASDISMSHLLARACFSVIPFPPARPERES